MNKPRRIKESSSFYQDVYSISMDDLVDIWIESFHPYGVTLVLFDVGKYFNELRDCGILCSQINAYENKILTVGLPGVEEALQTMDTIKRAGLCPIMYLYEDSKKILDNIEP